MGTALARLNFVCGFDGRDVEFVMGGSATSSLTDPAFYVIDFNQMRRLSEDEDACVAEIVAAITDNDPYFPRPDGEVELWNIFRQTYLFGACSDRDARVGRAVIGSLEEKMSSGSGRSKLVSRFN